MVLRNVKPDNFKLKLWPRDHCELFKAKLVIHFNPLYEEVVKSQVYVIILLK